MNIIWKGNMTSLSPSQLLGSGGEGDVYEYNSLAFKVCTGEVIPQGKIEDLSVLSDPAIIKPLEHIYNPSSKKPVGYTMPLVPQGSWVLCSLFPPGFKQREGLNSSHVEHLVSALRKGVYYIHQNRILLVDLNEMNFLVSKDFKSIFFIDVNSYQTPRYPATALMESVRDRHTKGFNTGSDWFSFAVITFQLFTGIHPYKGRHAKYQSVDERMVANISVLNPQVKVPHCIPNFSIIPSNYLEWYKSILDKGERTDPPSSFTDTIYIRTSTKLATPTDVVITEIMSYPHQIKDYNQGWVLLENGQVCDLKGNVARIHFSNGGNLLVSDKEPYIVSGDASKIEFTHCMSGVKFVQDLEVQGANVTENRVLVSSKLYLYPLKVRNLGNRMFADFGQTMSKMPLSAKMYPGVLIEQAMGMYYAKSFLSSGIILSGKLGPVSDGIIVNAQLIENCLITISSSNGKYKRTLYRMTEDASSWDKTEWNDISVTDINFCVLHNAVLVMTEDCLEVLSNKPYSTQRQQITDPAITSDCNLINLSGRAGFYKEDKLYQFSMKGAR